MSFRNCITNGVTDGLITNDQANKAYELFDDLHTQYKEKMSPAAAEAKAAQDTFNRIKSASAHKRRIKLMQIKTMQNLTMELAGYPKPNRPGLAIQALVSPDQFAKFSNLEKRFKVNQALLFGEMDAILGRFRKGVYGQTTHKAELNTVVREIFGKDTGNASAREMAQAWEQTIEKGRLELNRLGMRIPKLEGYGMPQSHVSVDVRKAGFDEWYGFIKDLLDKNKMINYETGLPFTDETLALELRKAFDTIASDGYSKIQTAGAASQGKMLANRRLDHRFLIFKNADSWIKYQERFGNPDPFHTMINHIDSIARDMTMLQILGPNPNATINALKTSTFKAASRADVANKTDKFLTLAKKDLSRFDTMMDLFTGKANTFESQLLHSWGAGTRNLLSSALLGSAPLTAISDLATMRLASRFIGMPQTAALKRMMSQIAPLDIEEKGRFAIRLGIAADNWIQTANAQARFFGETTGPEFTRRIADTSMRLSGLQPWTQAGRQAFGIELLGFLGDQTNKKFDDLPKKLQDAFNSYGIGKNKWEIIRHTKLYEHRGDKFLRPLDIEARGDLAPGVGRDLAQDLLELLHTETEYAVPTASIRARATLMGGSKGGTLPGEIIRSFGMFKNFPVTLTYTHIMRYIQMDGVFNKIMWMTEFIIGGTFMGALALQSKDIITRGRDPRPMDTAEFWGAALMQAGGLGIMGDFLFMNVNRFGGGLTTTIAGPSVQFYNDAKQLTVGNIMEMAQGKDTRFGNELVRFIGRYAPGSSNWYTRLAWERMALDTMQKWADPGAASSFRRRMRNQKKYLGSDSWWQPGRTMPSRGPELEGVIGR